MNCAYQVLWIFANQSIAEYVGIDFLNYNINSQCNVTDYGMDGNFVIILIDRKTHKQLNVKPNFCYSINQCSSILCNNIKRYGSDYISVVKLLSNRIYF